MTVQVAMGLKHPKAVDRPRRLQLMDNRRDGYQRGKRLPLSLHRESELGLIRSLVADWKRERYVENV